MKESGGGGVFTWPVIPVGGASTDTTGISSKMRESAANNGVYLHWTPETLASQITVPLEREGKGNVLLNVQERKKARPAGFMSLGVSPWAVQTGNIRGNGRRLKDSGRALK